MGDELKRALAAVLKRERDPDARQWLKALLRGDKPAARRKPRGGKHRKAAHK